ncbi:MAG TPA: MBL fold metallo-hydrolase [Spirochaetia bacterium]|nr:MBL fold metallo-hydrolase [Spirochaetia bacterium]
MAIQLRSRGAAGEVTGSRHLIDTGVSKVLVDCGAFQGRRKESDEKNRNTTFERDPVDAVILTHAHYDHCGLLPLLVKSGFRGNIYATGATRDLANIIMMDSAKIQARDAEYLAKQAAKRNEPFNWKPLYDTKDVVQTMTQFVTVSYERKLQVTSDVSVEFFDAGHILGSSMAKLRIQTTTSSAVEVLFSGDLGRRNKPIIRDPAPMPDADYLVLEATYGDRLHEKTDDILGRLKTVINDAVEREGKILIPAFAVERTQDIIYYLHLLSQQHAIPKIPIYVDSPMAFEATSVFKLHPECYDEETYDAFLARHEDPFGFASLHYIENVEESKQLNSQDGPMIIISSSGMCESGRIQHHLLHTVADPRNTVLIVGFMAKDTLGRKIQERRSELRILDVTLPLRARVEEIHALSGHADYGEIAEYVSHMDAKRIRGVYLVHGEPEALEHESKVLSSAGLPDVRIVEYGSDYSLE